MLTLVNIYIYIYIPSSSSCVASTDIPDPLSPLLPIIHRLWQVFRATSRIPISLLYVCSRWSSCFCLAILNRSTSLMSSSLLLQQCPACLVRLTWIGFVMGGRWPYSWCLVGVLPPGLVQYCTQHSLCNCRLVSSPAV